MLFFYKYIIYLYPWWEDNTSNAWGWGGDHLAQNSQNGETSTWRQGDETIKALKKWHGFF
jgi:hypothetical protein